MKKRKTHFKREKEERNNIIKNVFLYFLLIIFTMVMLSRCKTPQERIKNIIQDNKRIILIDTVHKITKQIDTNFTLQKIDSFKIENITIYRNVDSFNFYRSKDSTIIKQILRFNNEIELLKLENEKIKALSKSSFKENVNSLKGLINYILISSGAIILIILIKKGFNVFKKSKK